MCTHPSHQTDVGRVSVKVHSPLFAVAHHQCCMDRLIRYSNTWAYAITAYRNFVMQCNALHCKRFPFDKMSRKSRQRKSLLQPATYRRRVVFFRKSASADDV